MTKRPGKREWKKTRAQKRKRASRPFTVVDECYTCGKKGHWSRDCYKLRLDWRGEQEEEREGPQLQITVLNERGTAHTNTTHSGDNTDNNRVNLKRDTYVHYHTGAYQRLPGYALTVREKKLTFLVDSRATNSVIRAHDLSPSTKMSGFLQVPQ